MFVWFLGLAGRASILMACDTEHEHYAAWHDTACHTMTMILNECHAQNITLTWDSMARSWYDMALHGGMHVMYQTGMLAEPPCHVISCHVTLRMSWWPQVLVFMVSAWFEGVLEWHDFETALSPQRGANFGGAFCSRFSTTPVFARLTLRAV